MGRFYADTYKVENYIKTHGLENGPIALSSSRFPLFTLGLRIFRVIAILFSRHKIMRNVYVKISQRQDFISFRRKPCKEAVDFFIDYGK